MKLDLFKRCYGPELEMKYCIPAEDSVKTSMKK